MPERLECEVLQKVRYINTLTYLPTYSRSLKVVPFESLGFLFAFHSNCGRICSHFGDIQRQSKNGLTLKSGFGVFQGH